MMLKEIFTEVTRKKIKLEIQKKKRKLFDLGGSELIKNQESFSVDLELYFKSRIDYELRSKITPLILKNKVSKLSVGDIKLKADEYIGKGFNIGGENLNLDLIQNNEINISFSVDNVEVRKFAKERSGMLISQVNEYTEKRINTLVQKAISGGWGHDKIRKELIKDYSFSKYRANLIATNEIGTAYIKGGDRQFEKYLDKYNETGWKKWISHRDDKTSDLCRQNDFEDYIEYDKSFKSGHHSPPRFPGCRCNLSRRLFNPKDDFQDQTSKEPSETFKSFDNLKDAKGFLGKYVESPVKFSKHVDLETANKICSGFHKFYNLMPFLPDLPELKFVNRKSSRSLAYVESLYNRKEGTYIPKTLGVNTAHINNKTRSTNLSIKEKITIFEDRLKVYEENLKNNTLPKDDLDRLLQDIEYHKRRINDFKSGPQYWSMSEKYGEVHEGKYATTNLETTILHELTHFLDYSVLRKNPKWGFTLTKLYRESLNNNWVVSEYGRTSPEEFLAENFTAYLMGYTEKMPPKMKSLFDNIIKNDINIE